MVTEQGERGPKETRIRTDILGRGLHYGVERVYLEEFISDNHDNVDDDDDDDDGNDDDGDDGYDNVDGRSNKLRLTFKVKSRDIGLITGHSFFSVAQERRPPEDDMFLKRGVEKRMKRLHTCRNSLVPVTSCSLTARQPTKQDDKMSRTNYTRKLSRSMNENASQCTVRTCRICSTRLLSVALSSPFRGFFLYISN